MPTLQNSLYFEYMTITLKTAITLGMKQKTISKKVSIDGIGLHTGVQVTMHLLPSEENTGLIFRRTDIEEGAEIAATPESIVNTQLCSQMGNASGTTLGTIEHLMAALHVKGITNLVIEVDNIELPVLDGSSVQFMALLDEAGTTDQQAEITPLTVSETVEYVEDDRIARVEPADNFEIEIEIDYKTPQVKPEKASFVISEKSFVEQIQEARTFCFEKDIDNMHAMGLAKGGSLNNAVVMGDDGILNTEGWRYTEGESEIIRHKVLDIIGDLYLAGRPVLGKFYFKYPGHGMNNQLLRKMTKK